MGIRAARWWVSPDANELPVKIIPLLLLLMTAAAGAIIALAFQKWVHFGITETRGVDAEAATGISDGWFVAALAAVILALVGGVIFWSRLAPILLPMTAVAAVCILAIAGFDTVSNWNASGFHPEDSGILVQSKGAPTIVPYAIAGLAILIAFSAAVVRSIQWTQNPDDEESS